MHTRIIGSDMFSTRRDLAAPQKDGFLAHQRRRWWMLCLFGFALVTPDLALGASYQDRVINGFNKVVFGSEYSSGRAQSRYVRKFTREVRVHITDRARKNRANAAKRFVLGLRKDIRDLNISVAETSSRANFRVFIVDRKDYESTVRKEVFGNSREQVRGRCMVRSFFSRRGIRRSVAVILSDGGERIFRRCLIEEILQGLGPLNEDRRLMQSVFNDASRQSSFTRFDRIIMNMLYDPALKAGTSQDKAQAMLPTLYSRARRYVGG